MHFWIDIKFTKTLSQFKQKDICKFIHGHAIASQFFYPLNLIFLIFLIINYWISFKIMFSYVKVWIF